MNTNDSFYSAIKNAEKLGYTEPNPKDDLDKVGRKKDFNNFKIAV